MGFLDFINPEDRIEITKGELFAQLKNSAELEIIKRLIANGTPNEVIATAFGIEIKKARVELEIPEFMQVNNK